MDIGLFGTGVRERIPAACPSPVSRRGCPGTWHSDLPEPIPFKS